MVAEPNTLQPIVSRVIPVAIVCILSLGCRHVTESADPLSRQEAPLITLCGEWPTDASDVHYGPYRKNCDIGIAAQG